MTEGDREEKIEFKWGKKRGRGGKSGDVQFYESFTYDGVEYTLFDSVYLYKEGEQEPFIGKLVKIWEKSDKTKKVKVLWFFRPCEILNFLSPSETHENELFLACGEGLGLANLNPLEALVGKCNVICISKDSRNPQPSDEELQKAEYVFYRFFDVGQRKILDKIDDKIAGVDVKDLLNKLDSQKPDGVGEHGLDKKEVSGKQMEKNQVLTPSSQNNGQSITEKDSGQAVEKLVRENVDCKLSMGEKPTSCVCVEDAIKSGDGLSDMLNDKTNEVEKKEDSKTSLVKKKSNQKSHDGEERKHEVVSCSHRQDDVKREVKSLLDTNGLVQDKPSKKVQLGGSGKNLNATMEVLEREQSPKSYNRLRKTSGEKTTSRPMVDGEERKREVVRCSGGQDDVRREVKSTLDTDGRQDDGKREVKSTLDTNGLVHDRQSKKAQLGGSGKNLNGKSKPGVQNRRLVCDDDNDDYMKNVAPSVVSSKDKCKVRRAKDSNDVEEVPSKKLKLDDKPTKSTRSKSHKESSTKSSIVETKDSCAWEVTRRPDAEKSRWFKGFPWEERLKSAHEQGTLLLLQNLDPSLTSQEVEDIVWHGFKESCTAKMIQPTAFSSRHSGQAFAVFKRREAAESVARKLNQGCLLMSNGRPLVGSIGCPCFPEKKPIFHGHLVIDQLRLQMQREMKDAISTSHCAQPNNIEYEMAMEWCLLQERADYSWRKLHKQQGEELRKVKAKLKAK